MTKAITLGAGMVGSLIACDLAKDPSIEVLAVDYSEKSLENARALAARLGVSIEVLHAKDQSERRGDPDGGSSPDGQTTDRTPHLLRGLEVQDLEFPRQESLVNQSHSTGEFPGPLDRRHLHALLRGKAGRIPGGAS